MTVWVFYLDNVTEYAQMPKASLCPHGSLLYDPYDAAFPHFPWWEAHKTAWLIISPDEVPIEYKTMAFLLT